MRGRMGAALLAASLLLGATACTSHGGVPRNVVRVAERDFNLSLQEAPVRAGPVTIQVHNAGPDTHEVIVVRSTGVDGRLPLRKDGLTVDEEALGSRTAGTIEQIGPGTTRTATFQLPPGRYELFCNMAGHYLSGMHVELLVKAA